MQLGIYACPTLQNSHNFAAGKCCLNCPRISTGVLFSHPTTGVIALITRPVTGYGYHSIPARRKLFQIGWNWCTMDTRQVNSQVCEVLTCTWSVSSKHGSLVRRPYHQVVSIHGFVTLGFTLPSQSFNLRASLNVSNFTVSQGV